MPKTTTIGIICLVVIDRFLNSVAGPCACSAISLCRRVEKHKRKKLKVWKCPDQSHGLRHHTLPGLQASRAEVFFFQEQKNPEQIFHFFFLL